VGAGSGGVGSGGQVPSGNGDNDFPRDPAKGTVFDPVGFEPGDEVRVRLDGSPIPGQPTGSTQGQGQHNLAVTPYADHFAEYRDSAIDSLDRSVLPAGMQDLVRGYFTELEP
jgi:hypothetical protein